MKAAAPVHSPESDQTLSLFLAAAERAAAYRRDIAARGVKPRKAGEAVEQAFGLPTPEFPSDPADIIHELADAAEPGLMGVVHPRFFGWVMGGSHPAGAAADFLTSAWGQNCAMSSTAPAAAYAEKAVASWILDLLDLPRRASVGFVTGATMANFTCLAAARTHMFSRLGWDVDTQGLIGAPPLRILIGEDAHASVYSALQYLGFGRGSAVRIATDAQGRMIPTALRTVLSASDTPAIVIAQAGQINTGGIDPFNEIAPICRTFGAWLHVDGAFGIWARACEDRRHLAAGIEQADSWATDGHKWLQLPYESGFAIVKDAAAHRAAMTISASYLRPEVNGYEPKDYVPELSRRARGFPAWAVLRTLGRQGVDELISRHCRCARLVANRLRREPGLCIRNSVTLNQVIVDFALDGEDRKNAVREIVDAIQREDAVFVETSQWRTRTVIRISVTGNATTEADIEVLADAIIRAWRASAHNPQASAASLQASS